MSAKTGVLNTSLLPIALRNTHYSLLTTQYANKMKTQQIHLPWIIEDITGELSLRHKIGVALVFLLSLFLFSGTLLQIIDPSAGVLDIGILSILLLSLLGGAVAIFASLWLQEILWQPFKFFRKQFFHHFNQLTSWQQSILYFSVFFLLLYALLWGLEMVL